MTSIIELIVGMLLIIGVIFFAILTFFYGIKYSRKPLLFKELVKIRRLFAISSLIISLGGAIGMTTSGLHNGSVTWIEIIIVNVLCLIGFPLVTFVQVDWIFGRLVVKRDSE